MGAQLAGLVFARWTHLNDTAFRILMRMAITALDQEKDGAPARLYFGGHHFLAESLRRPFPRGDTEEAKKARRYVLRDVQRTTKFLVEDGALEVVDTGRPVRQGEAKVYRLTLWNVSKSAPSAPDCASGEGGVRTLPEGGVTALPRQQIEDSPRGVQNPPSGRGENPSSGRGEDPHEGGVRTLPRNHGGTKEEPWEEDRADIGAQPQDARASESEGERPPLRSVPTQGVRDPVPPGGGVPGQQPFITSVTDPSPPPGDSEAPEEPEASFGPCGSCGRNVLRSRHLCPHCKKPTRIGEVS